MKFCVNCKHYRESKKYSSERAYRLGLPLTEAYVQAHCMMMPKGSPDMVYGHQEYHTCDVGRRTGGSCGPEAKLFVQR